MTTAPNKDTTMTTTPAAPDDDDWAGFSQAMRKLGQARRASNREQSAQMLMAAGVVAESKNAGAHLIVRARGLTFDFWPGTGLWQQRGSTKQKRGVRLLIKTLKELTNA